MGQIGEGPNLLNQTAQRSQALFETARQRVYRRTDRVFAGLMMFQWLAGVALALWMSRRTWSGPNSLMQVNVRAAIFLGGAITFVPVMLALLRPGKTLTRHAIAVGEMLTSALLIHLTGGRIETHFHIFGALAFLAFYRDWRVLVSASAVVISYHFLLGYYDPQSVYGVVAIQPWRWLEAAGWVIFEDAVLITFILQGVTNIRSICEHQAALEVLNSGIEQQVRDRTTQLQESGSLLKDSESKLRKVFDATQDIIVINRLRDGAFVDANVAIERFGFARAWALDNCNAGLCISLPTDEWNRYVAAIQAEGAVHNLETELRFKDGTISPSLVSGVLIELNGEPCVVSIIRDITLFKQTERKLIAASEAALAASKAKSEFLSSMSHEIRTPMNAVLGMADLLSESELSGEQRRYLDVMVANGNSLLDLINNVLDLAKIESGRLQIEKTEFGLTELVDRTISTFGVSAHGKGLELAARIAPGVPDRLVGDPLRLRQILVNLLGNAIKFTELGEVVLTVERSPASSDPGDLLFSVSDTGVGIPPNNLEAIFSSFTQADSSTTRQYGGSGLGLSIANRLVRLMNGNISVESEINKGSKFAFTAQFGLASRLISPTADVVLRLTGKRILVVDDNDINRLIVREMLSNCGAGGADVEEAESGPAALAAIRQATDEGKPFRIILLDMRMPGMDGLEVARRIREERLPIKPLILMLSSDDLKPQLTRMQELGLDAYLMKPITRKDLFQAIRRVIDNANRYGVNATIEEKPPDKKRTPPSDADKTKILVAEDSPDNRLVIAAYLRNEPYQVDFAENGKEAIEKFTSYRYDLVFMDIQMPVIDGLTATRTIREWETNHNLTPTPIIALTASVLEEDVKRALAAGCDMHVSKPVKKRALLNAIRSAAFLWSAPLQVSQ